MRIKRVCGQCGQDIYVINGRVSFHRMASGNVCPRSLCVMPSAKLSKSNLALPASNTTERFLSRWPNLQAILDSHRTLRQLNQEAQQEDKQ